VPIVLPSIPPAVSAALAEGLPRFAAAASAPPEGTAPVRSTRPSLARSARTISRSVTAALAPGADPGMGAPVTVLGLDQLADGQGPRQAKASLWVQLLPAQGTERAMVEVDQNKSKLTSISEGPEVKALGQRIGALTRSRSTTGVQQELALIRVPALHLTAVWLKGAAGDEDDVVIPSDGPIAPLVPGQRYPMAEFMRVAGAMAAERLAKTGDEMGG
jgi:hypothetical protein